ncbi:LCP family protein [Actinomyces sp. 2119]|uniref:LCP family protein n=1 Tax=Actinomyces sp. 2119 TaxID=2321393 RepID=UPI002175CAD5|nr:LCP family protein [Actinomyces sp. 2119]
MTSSDDSLPPSIAPGSGQPSQPRRQVRPASTRGGGASSQPQPGASSARSRRPHGQEAGSSRAAAQAQSPAVQPPGSREPEAGSALGRQPRRPHPAPGASAGSATSRSRARAGSRAVPLSSDAPSQSTRPGIAPGRRPAATSAASSDPGTRVMPASMRTDIAGDAPYEAGPPQEGDTTRGRRHHPLRWVAAVLALLLVLAGARAAWLWHGVSSGLQRVEALSGAGDTPGETWLVVGSDSRADGAVQDGTEGARADSIMLLHRADNGQASLTTLPRDTYTEIPGYGGNKINTAYAFGGPQLLVETVESLSGLTVDHYVEVGMGGVSQMVDAVGGVEVCMDYDVDDADSGLVWDTSQGTCQEVDGAKALAYARMRKSDPTGDIGRGLRQRAVISAVVSKAASASTLVSFSRQDALVDSGTQVLTVEEEAGVVDLGQMVLAFRSASGEEMTGAPPIADLAYAPGGIGESVLLQDTTAPEFFTALRDGELTPHSFNQS